MPRTCTIESLEARMLFTAEWARPADAFVDSVGVNIHMHYTDTMYNSAWTTWRQLLIDSGIRHVRDGLQDTTGFSAYYTRFQNLAASGIRGTFLPDNDGGAASIAAANLLGQQVVEAFEGQNEIINVYNGSNNPTAAAAARAFQLALYNAVKGDPNWANRPVLAPTVVGSAAATTLGTVAADYGNIHSYPYVRNSTPPYNISSSLGDAEQNTSDRAVYTTETGFTTALNDTNGKQPISNTAHGKYIPRVLFENFNAGVVRTFLYEFIDRFDGPGNDDEEDHYGLIENVGGTLAPKPGYTAIKNLNTILKEATWNAGSGTWTTPQFTPGALNYELLGDTANVHHTLLQKSNGKFYLVLWKDAVSYDNTTNPGFDVSVPTANVTLQLSTGISSAQKFDPLVGTTGTALTINSGSIALGISDQITVIELTPSGTAVGGPSVSWNFNDADRVTTAGSSVPSGASLSLYGGAYKSGNQNRAVHGTALALDGTTGYGYTGAISGLDASGDVTVSAWIQLDTVGGGTQSIISSRSATGGWELRVASGKLVFVIVDSAGVVTSISSISGGTNLQAGQWYHVAGVFNDSQNFMRTYVNGNIDRALTTTAAHNASTSGIYVGRRSSSAADFFDGAIDEVRVQRSALSATYVRDYLAAGKLSRHGWTVSASHTQSGYPANNAITNSLRDRWRSGTSQNAGQWFQIDRGSAALHPFNRIVLDSGADAYTYPRGYAIYVSDTGTDWATLSPIKTGNGTSGLLDIWLDQPLNTRFIRIVLTQGGAGGPWGIENLNLFG